MSLYPKNNKNDKSGCIILTDSLNEENDQNDRIEDSFQRTMVERNHFHENFPNKSVDDSVAMDNPQNPHGLIDIREVSRDESSNNTLSLENSLDQRSKGSNNKIKGSKIDQNIKNESLKSIFSSTDSEMKKAPHFESQIHSQKSKKEHRRLNSDILEDQNEDIISESMRESLSNYEQKEPAKLYLNEPVSTQNEPESIKSAEQLPAGQSSTEQISTPKKDVSEINPNDNKKSTIDIDFHQEKPSAKLLTFNEISTRWATVSDENRLSFGIQIIKEHNSKIAHKLAVNYASKILKCQTETKSAETFRFLVQQLIVKTTA